MDNHSLYFNPNQNNETKPIHEPPKVFEKKAKFIMTKKDLVFTFIFVLLGFIISNFVIFNGLNLGFTVAFILLFLATTVYLFDSKVKVSLFSYLCGALSIAGSVTFALYDDLMINAIMLFLVLALFTVYTCGLSATFRHRQGSFKMLADVVGGVLISPFANSGDIALSYSKSFKKSKGIKNVIIGFAVSIPVLLIVIPLLKSSDAAFDGLVEHLLESLGEYIFQLLAALLISPVLVLYFVNKAKRLDVEKGAKASASFKGIFQPSATGTFLSVISVTYLVYLFSQLAYFFSAFSGILPQGYTFSASEYARRGFFEMFAICVINMIIITLCCLLTKKHKGKIQLPIKLLSLFILLFTTLILITAMAKMKLNIETYALSKNRLMVSVFMLMMIVVIVFYIIHLFAPKVSYMQPIIIICSAMFIALSYSNVDYQIAKYNVNAYTSGKIDTIDVDNLSDMSNGAVPYLIELADNDNHLISKQAKTAVLSKIEENFDVHFNTEDKTYFPIVECTDNHDFRIYNKSKVNARKELDAFYNALDKEQKANLITQFSFDEGGYFYDEEKDEYTTYSGEYEYYYVYDDKDDKYEYSGLREVAEDYYEEY